MNSTILANPFKLFLSPWVSRSFSKVQVCFNLCGFTRPIPFNPVHNWPSRRSNACYTVMGPRLWETSCNVIYLYTKPLPRERHMSASQRQWLATIRALDKFRPRVFSQKFTLWTNHQTLTWLRRHVLETVTPRVTIVEVFVFPNEHPTCPWLGKRC